MSGSDKRDASIASQAVKGSVYSVSASLITLGLGLARSVLLARLLMPEHFGVVALALFYIGLASHLRSLGLDMALIHRQDEHPGLKPTYLSLRLGLDVAAMGVLLAALPLLQRFYPGMPALGKVLPLLIVGYLLSNLSQVQETLLRKDLAFLNLSCMDVAASLVMTVAAPYAAWRGWGVWALVVEQLSGLGTRFLLSWGPFRRWRPRLGWDPSVVRWFWKYGKPTWTASNLSYLLDQFDDFWVGSTLGGTALGFYSKAYELALYPRRVFANPLVSVLAPVFARVQNDRLRLSQLFYRSAHFTLRTGYLIGGAMALAMPEFIHLVIGDKWQPLLWTFRLMLAYTALDSVLMLVENMLLAVGRPRELQTARLAQLVFFVPAVILGAWLWRINGVALAADGMLLVGAWRLYHGSRQVVDFSLARLALWPTLAIGAAFGAGVWLEAWLPGPPLAVLAAKLGVFALLSGGFVLWAEREDYIRGARWLWDAMRRREAAA